jgi:hypothetical protein
LTTKIIQRCSRPLCSSQATTGPHPYAGAYHHRGDDGSTDQAGPQARPPAPASRRRPPRRSAPRQQPRRAVPSGPNSVPSRPSPPADIRSHPHECGVLGATGKRAGHSRCSTLELHPRHVRPRRGPGHHRHP